MKINHSVETNSGFASPEKDVTTLAGGASITFVGKIVGRGFVAITDIFLARFLGPTSFGLYAIGLSILRILTRIGILGLNNGVIQFGTRYRRTSIPDLKSTLIYSIGFSLISGLTLSGILFILAPWLANDVFNKPDLMMVFRLFTFAFPLAIGMYVASAATRITKRMKYSVLGEDITQPVVNLLALLAFWLLGLKLGGAVLAIVVSFGFALGLLLFYVKKLFADTFAAKFGSNFRFQELIIYSLPTGLAGTFALLTSWVGRLFIGFFRPAAAAGVYQAAAQVSVIFVIILSSLNTVFTPMIADLNYQGELDRLGELYRISTKWGLYIILPIYLVICFFPQELMVAVFGMAYISGAIPLVILASTQVINVGTGAVGFLLVMTGNQNRWFFISGISFIISLILGIALVPRFGMVGAAMATGIAISVLYLTGLFQTRRVLGLWPYDRRYLKGLLATGFSASSLFLFDLFTDIQSPLMVILISMVVAAGIFWIVLLVLGLDEEDQLFIQIVVTRVKNLTSSNYRDDAR